MGSDLYNGICGVALFFARLHQLTGEKLYRATAEAGVAHSLLQLADIPAAARTSFYLGLSGRSFCIIPIAAQRYTAYCFFFAPKS